MDERQLAIDSLTRGIDGLAARSNWRPLPHQIIPPGTDWYGWVGLMGRGCGKTDVCAHKLVQHVYGPPCLNGPEPHRVAIIGPVQGDAANSGFYGPSGIRAHDPSTTLIASRLGGAIITWPNGSVGLLVGAHTPDDVERLRSGGNRCFVWFEELAAMRYMDEAFDQALLGLRVGPRPQWVASTTPKPRDLIKQFAPKDLFQYRGQWSVPFAGQQVIVQHAVTGDNPFLPDVVRSFLVERHGGTTLGAQELEAIVVDEDPNALWKRSQIEQFRVTPEQTPRELMRRIIVGVDPSGGAGEQGIIVVGFSDAPLFHPLHTTGVERGFVLDDFTCTLPPEQWGARAVNAAITYDASEIVFESDYGRDMPKAVLVSAANDAGLHIPIRPALAQAIGNKRARAYPVSAKAAQGRYPHVGRFPELEDQLCTWTEADKHSPDRMDAMVWPAWHSGFVSTAFTGAGELASQYASRSLTRRR